MSEMFTYSYIRRALISESYIWEDNLEVIERVINPSEVLIAYPKSLCKGNSKEICIFFFLENCIYNLISENGKSYRLIAFNPKNILKKIINIQGKENATLNIVFLDEEIILSSSDSPNTYQDYKYVEALLEIAKLYF